MPAILQKAVKRSREIIMEFLEHLMTKIYKFTAIVEKICFVKELPINIFSKKNIEWATEMLTVCRQQEIYIRYGSITIIIKFNVDNHRSFHLFIENC